MVNQILHEALEDITEDTKLIKLATITTIFHSLITVGYLLYNTYFIMSIHDGIGTIKLDSLQYYFKMIFDSQDTFYLFIVIILILLSGYFLLPPIAEGALIHYMNSDKKSGTESLGKGFINFFAMFEFDSLISLFSYLVFFIAVSRFYALGILTNTFVITILILRALMNFVVGLLLPYVKFLIIIDKKPLSDALKDSVTLSLNNFATTFKFILVNYLLHIRFILNILLVIGVPVIILYIFIKFDVSNSSIIKTIVYSSFFLLVAITAYINGIIEAFFLSYWYRVYKEIKK